MMPIADRRIAERASAGTDRAVAQTVTGAHAMPEPFPHEAIFYAPPGRSESMLSKEGAHACPHTCFQHT